MRRGAVDPFGHIRKVALMEGRDRVESLGCFEIAAAHEKHHLIGARAQAGGDVLKRRGKVEASFGLRSALLKSGGDWNTPRSTLFRIFMRGIGVSLSLRLTKDKRRSNSQGTGE